MPHLSASTSEATSQAMSLQAAPRPVNIDVNATLDNRSIPHLSASTSEATSQAMSLQAAPSCW
jgi:hypothetical protein